MNRQQQEQLFGQWMQDHAAILHHTAHGFAAGHDRDDLMQELMMAVWKAIPAWREEAAPSTFLYRVAHNTALNWERGRRHYQRRLQAWEEEQAGNSHSHEEDTGRLEALYAAIRRLPELDRSLVLLSLDDLSHRTIAAIHGLTETTTGVRLHRARQQLTRLLLHSGPQSSNPQNP